MQRKRKVACIVTIILIGLITSTTACETTRIEYVREIPEVTFPVFPPPDFVAYDPDTDMVIMPLFYWQQVAEYKIDIDAIQHYLDVLREVEKARIAEFKK